MMIMKVFAGFNVVILYFYISYSCNLCKFSVPLETIRRSVEYSWNHKFKSNVYVIFMNLE